MQQQVKATVPRIVHLHPAFPRPTWCHVWEWTVIAEHGDTLTVTGPGMPKGGSTVHRESPSWVMHEDRASAVLELRRRIELALGSGQPGEWKSLLPEFDPRVPAEVA